MTEKQIRRKFEDLGLKLVDVSDKLAEEFGVNDASAASMLNQLISGKGWYPRYNAWLEKKYGIVVDRPKWLRPVRERLAA